MFEHYLLDKQACTNLKIFKYLKNNAVGSVTVADLAKVIDASYSKAQHSLIAIVNELAQMRPDLAVDLPPKIAGFRVLAASISRDEYQHFLFTESLVFKLFNQIFQGNPVDIAAFTAANDSSISTIRRKTEPFREFLLNNGILLDIKTWQISGNEVNLRSIMTAMYSEIYACEIWPFNAISETETMRQFAAIQARRDALGFEHLDFVPRVRLIGLAVQLLRIQQGHYYTATLAVSTLAQSISEIDPLIFTPANFPNVPQRPLLAELNYYYFTEIMRLNYSGVDSTFQARLRAFFTQRHNPIGEFVDGLIDVLRTRLDQITYMQLSENKCTLTNLYRIAYAYYVVGPDFADTNYLGYTNQPLLRLHPLTGIIGGYISAIPLRSPLHGFKRFQPHIAQSLALVVLPTVGHYAAEPLLTARLSLEFLDMDVLDVMNTLQNSGWVQLLPSSSSSTPDVLITTATEAGNMLAELQGDFRNQHTYQELNKQQVIYWNVDHTEQEVLCLSRMIKVLAQEKMDRLCGISAN